MRDLKAYDPETLSELQFCRLDQLFNVQKVTIENMMRVGLGCVGVTKWLREVYLYYKIKNR